MRDIETDIYEYSAYFPVLKNSQQINANMAARNNINAKDPFIKYRNIGRSYKTHAPGTPHWYGIYKQVESTIAPYIKGVGINPEKNKQCLFQILY